MGLGTGVACGGGRGTESLKRPRQRAPEAREGAWRTRSHTWRSSQVSEDQPCLLSVLGRLSWPRGS